MKCSESPNVLLVDMHTKESVKAAALLKVYLALKNNKLKTIYNDEKAQTETNAEFQKFFSDALKNPDLTSERNSITTKIKP